MSDRQEVKSDWGKFIFPMLLEEALTDPKITVPTLKQLSNLFYFFYSLKTKSRKKEEFSSLLSRGFVVNHTLDLNGGKLMVYDCLPTRITGNSRLVDLSSQQELIRCLECLIEHGNLGSASDPPKEVPLIASLFDHKKNNGDIAVVFLYEYNYGECNYYPLWAVEPDEYGRYWVMLSRKAGPPPIAEYMTGAYCDRRNGSLGWQTSHLIIEPVSDYKKPKEVIGLKI